MAGFFSWMFGSGNRRRGQTYPQTQVPGPVGTTVGGRTDNRRPTPNAQPTGRKAIPRGSAEDPNAPAPTTPPPVPGLIPDPITAAHMAAFRQRRKGRTQRASALLGGGSSTITANLRPRTLIGS